MGIKTGLAALVGLAGFLGCADFHTQLPVPGYVLHPGYSVEMDECGRTTILNYIAPESGDGEKDDIAELSCYEPFSVVKTLTFHIGGKGRFYGCGILFDYDIENDNDSDPSNNVLLFSARLW